MEGENFEVVKTKNNRRQMRRKRSQRRNTKYNLECNYIPEEALDVTIRTDAGETNGERDSTVSVDSVIDDKVEVPVGIMTDATVEVQDRSSVTSIEAMLEQIELRNHDAEYSNANRVSSVVLDAMMAAPPEDGYEPQDSKKDEFPLSETEEQVSENIRHLSRNAATYELENFDSNVMYIFNQVNVSGYEPRRGTEYDVMALKRCFSELGFKVHVYNDFDKSTIFKTLEYASNSDFTDMGCVSVVMLTHGSRGGYLQAKDRQFHESEIINFFKTHNKPTLVTKPKIFIIQAKIEKENMSKRRNQLPRIIVIFALRIQVNRFRKRIACRGTKASAAAEVGRAVQNIKYDATKETEFYTLPTESDMILLHSTYAGNVAHREEQSGSWFIQTLCKSITEMCDTADFETIVTHVLKHVAIFRQNEVFNRRTGQIDINKQMPVKTSTLIRKLYFKSNSRRSKIDSGVESTSDINDRDSFMNYGYLHGSLVTVEHFDYLKTALRCFYEENPEATMTLPLLNIADSIDLDEVSYNVRHSIAREIENYLRNYAINWKYYNLIYLSGI